MNIKKCANPFKFLILIIALFWIWYLGRYFNIDTQSIQKYLGKYPLIFSSILFILLYVVVTFFVWLSKDFFWLAGALLFGAVFSALLVWIAEIINAFILFYLARCLGRGYVERSLAERYRKLDGKLGDLSFIWLFIFRAAPLIPYRFMDLASGLTRMPFKRYLAAVILGSAFKIFWLQYVLAGVGKSVFDNPAVIIEYFLSNKTLLMLSLIYPIFVIAVWLKIKAKD
jgi:uncharacterized membrane protein YdjX (TVP38/TMEM64 family)